MIKICEGNIFSIITEENINFLMNAANGIGPMGAGIAGAIRKHGGEEIQREAIQVCMRHSPDPGDAYRTSSGVLKKQGVEYIIHAVTMKNPGGDTSYQVVEKAFRSAIQLVESISDCFSIDNPIMACTALGTGVGRLDSEKVAEIMYKVAKETKKVNIVFSDMNILFINKLKELKDVC